MSRADILGEAVLNQIAEIGRLLKVARINRSQTLDTWRERVSISPSTIKRIERGDDGVSMGNFIAYLYNVNPEIVDQLVKMVSPENDIEGQVMAKRWHPRRARNTGPRRKKEDPMLAKA